MRFSPNNAGNQYAVAPPQAGDSFFTTAQRYEQAKILQASGKINTEADYLKFLGLPDLRAK